MPSMKKGVGWATGGGLEVQLPSGGLPNPFLPQFLTLTQRVLSKSLPDANPVCGWAFQQDWDSQF